MRTVYTDLNIKVQIDGVTFYCLNIVFEKFLRSLPKHRHGNYSYELHYIPYGHGYVNINGTIYEINPNTLYMTGPHIEHEQIPMENDPMAEYCIYFKLKNREESTANHNETIAVKFANTWFWFGQDSQDLYPLMQQIFYELERKYTGYMLQVETLLQQCIVKMVRNYENHQHSRLHFAPSNLVDSKYLIVEESFLYEFETLTLDLLAERLGLGIRQTERFLVDYYGKNFNQKKMDAKMSMATIYLKDKHLSISEISIRLNYSSIQHFSYAFKHYFGCSPREYRKNNDELHC